MPIVTQIDCLQYGDMLAFIGNSLLKPMTQTQSVGLDPLFWKSLPDFGEDSIGEAVSLCEGIAERIGRECGERAVEVVSVEYTRLFVGLLRRRLRRGRRCIAEAPMLVLARQPSKCAIAWRNIGLELSNENRQYEDHMGIELLYLSELCRCAVKGENCENQLRSFIAKHPLSWIDAFLDRIEGVFPKGTSLVLFD